MESAELIAAKTKLADTIGKLREIYEELAIAAPDDTKDVTTIESSLLFSAAHLTKQAVEGALCRMNKASSHEAWLNMELATEITELANQQASHSLNAVIQLLENTSLRNLN